MKVLYVTAKGGIHDYRFLVKLVKDYRVLVLHYAADEMIPDIKHIEGLEIVSKKPVFKAFPLISEIRHFRKVVRRFNPDIVHTGYVWQVGILASYAKVHPHLSMPWGSDVLTEPDKKFWIKKLVSKVFRTCDHIQCDAEFVKAKIVSDYSISPGKITVFPWGIDVSLFKPLDKTECRRTLGIPTETFVVIYNRYLEEVYGAFDLLNAFNEFAKDKDNVQLLMVSDGSLKKEVENYISANKLEPKIKMTGKVANEKLPQLLGSADVYISTSLSDGTSLSLLEALAMGLGIVVTDVPAIKEWVSDKNGIVVTRQNIKQITGALQKYYENPELIETHGKRNIQLAAEKADWDKNYEKLKSIYSKLTST